MLNKRIEEVYLEHQWSNASSLEKTFLAHHGILGQKWGIRRFQNPDGTLTEAGKKRYRAGEKEQKKIHKIFNDASASDDVSEKVFDVVRADKKYLEEAKNVLNENLKVQKEITKETDELFKDLRNNENIHLYEAASELADYAHYFHEGVDECSIHELGSIGFHGVLDDGQQGVINAYSMYAHEQNLGKTVSDLAKKASDSNKITMEQTREIISEAFAEVGGENLNAYPKNSGYTAAKSTADHMMNSNRWDDWKSTSGSWYLNQANSSNDFSEIDKLNMQKAKNYINKIDGANKENTWWHVTAAAENLNISNSKLKDLSQSDWDRINKEIARLKGN